MQNRISFSLVPILLIIAIVLGFLLRTQLTRSQADSDKVQQLLVLDCSSNNFEKDKDHNGCVTRNLDSNIKNCTVWEPWEVGKPLCEHTAEGLEQITYIADPANYIPLNFTQAKYAVETLPVNLDTPWDLNFLPDGSMLITEKISGDIKHVQNSTTRVVSTIDIQHKNQTGLLGLAVDPEYSSNGYIYLYYTDELINEETGRVNNTIVRYTLLDGKLNDKKVLIDTIIGSRHHSGGRLAFGPDGKLYASTGDAEDNSLPQDPSSLSGKILRMNKDGSIPSDNPFKNSYVYTYGHRNPQGITWNRITGDMFASEHGTWRQDEINHIIPGENYGWPLYGCDEMRLPDLPDFAEAAMLPIYCTKSWTMAPSGIEFINDPESPWNGNLFVAMLRGKQINRMIIKDATVVESEIFYVTENPESDKITKRIRDVGYYNGSLYAIGDGFGLIKITPQ